MSKERTPLISLHEHAFTVEVDAVGVGFFERYNFTEGHRNTLLGITSTLILLSILVMSFRINVISGPDIFHPK